MKTKHFLKKIVVVTVCLTMTFVAKAVTTATTFAELQSQFATASASGVPSTINIGADIAVDADFSMVSTGDTVTLNFVPYRITVTSGTFTIGDKVKITVTGLSNAVQALAGGTIVVNSGCNIVSTATCPIIAAGGNVIVNGGEITTSNYPATGAGMSILVSGVATASGGNLTINGGYIATKATGIARGVGIDYGGICIINGGEIHSDGGGGRAVSINATNSGGKLYVNGGTITAIGATGRAIQIDNNNASAWIKGSPTINGGLEAIMVQKSGVVVLSGTPAITGVIGTNAATAKLYDARNISNIVASPGTGYYPSSQSVTLSGATGTIYKYVNTTSQASATSVTATLVYTTDGTSPVAASTAYASPVAVSVPSTLNVAPLIEGTSVGCVSTFNYYLTGTLATAAPTPPAYTTAKEISIFSDAFTNVAGTNFNPNWGQSTIVSTVKIDGTSTLEYSNLNYQGTALATHVNAASMKYLHLDVWSADETSLQITPISPATPANKEFLVSLTPLVQNNWNSYDVPLTAFIGVPMADVFQFKVVGSGGKTVYIENLYFYDNDPTPDTQAPTAFSATKGAVTYNSVELLLNATDNSGGVNYTITYGSTTLTTGGASGVEKSFIVTGLNSLTDYSFSVLARDMAGNTAASPIVVTATTASGFAVPAVSAPTPTIAADKVISIYSNAYTNLANTNFNPNWNQTTIVTTFNLGEDSILKYENFNYQGTEFGSDVNASTMTKLHVDIFTPNETSVKVQPISRTGGGVAVALTPLNLNGWNSFDIPLTSFSQATNNLFQLMFSTGTGKIIYLDNIYFYDDAVAPAVTQVTDSTSFATAFSSMKTTGGGTIELLNDITIRPAKGAANVYALESNAANPININTNQFKIIASGSGATGDSVILKIGNDVDIYGTAVVLNNINRAIIRVVGGSVKTTASFPGALNPAAIQTGAGWVYISGGTVSVEAAVPTNAYALYMENYMSAVITGGIISAIGDNTRAVSISDGSATVISGATITANGNGAYALQALGGLLMTIGNDLTVTTTSADGTDAALVSGGATSRIIIPSTATNVSITSSHKYKLDNTAAAVLDMRDVTLTANPVSGTAFVNPSNVVLTASGNESMSLAGIYYSYDAVPTTSSSNINSGGSVLAPFATTTIKASIGKAGYIDPIVYTYIYTVQNPLQITLISTFEQLKDAYTASLTASDTTRLKLTANIITDAAFTMTPDATHPIILDANGFYIQTGVSASTFTTTFGGDLKVISTLSTGSGIFKLMGQTVTNITGGSYTLNGNGQILFANSGSGVNVNTTKLNLSDATFVVIGTSNAASIVKFATSDGNLISATNCNFMVSAKGVAFSCVGPQYITIKNCTLTIGGNDATSIAFSQSPTNAVNKSDLTVDGLMLNMAAGKVFTWGGSKNINTVIKDLELIGSAVIEKPTTGTGTVRKFYDFRADTLKATPAAGEYAANQSVVLSMAVGSAYDADSATLVYTLDGTEPTALSTVYSAPIVTNDSTTLIKVAALKDGFLGKSVLFTYKKAVISGQPTVGAPTPPALAAAKVVSIFSDAFTSATGTNFNPNWGQSTVYSALQIGGNNTIKYANLNYQGMALANPVNAVAMTTLHIDVWTADETSLQITPISPGTPNKEFSVPLTPLVQNSWNSFDVPLSAFTGVSMADVFQFKVVGSGGKTVYLDNLYFYNNSTVVDTEAPTAFTATVGAITHNSIELLLNATDNSGAVTYGITFGDTTLFTGSVSGVQRSFVVKGLAPLTDYSFSVSAKDLTGNAAVNGPIVVPAKTLSGLTAPTVSAPTPTAAANKVISIYSNAYTNVAGTNFNPYWNQNTLVTTFNLGADAILKYENFNYQGTEFGNDVDASGMTKMHVDVFTPNETSVKVQPISHTGGGVAVALTPLTLNAWNSFDIPLTSFNQATNNLFQLMFSTGTGKIVYLDNIYFFNDTVAVSVSKPKASNDVTIYPTLVSNTITLVSGSEMSQVVVRNLLGQTVKTFGIDNREITLDLSDVTTGNYFMTIKLANGQYTTQKFVKL